MPILQSNLQRSTAACGGGVSEEGRDVLRRRSSGDEVDEEAGDVLRRRLSQPRAGGSRSSRCGRARAARRRARRRAARRRAAAGNFGSLPASLGAP